MNTTPDCHPETPQWLTEEQRNALLDAAIDAEKMAHQLWRAYYTDQYNDYARTEHAIDEARIYQYIIRNRIKLLPPSTDFPANAIPENDQ